MTTTSPFYGLLRVLVGKHANGSLAPLSYTVGNSADFEQATCVDGEYTIAFCTLPNSKTLEEARQHLKEELVWFEPLLEHADPEAWFSEADEDVQPPEMSEARTRQEARLRKRQAAKAAQKAQEPEEPSAKHCDDYIHDFTAPHCLRFFLLINRLPAIDGALCREFGVNPKLFATYKGERVRVVMASRMGDVGITRKLTAENGYEGRVMIDDLADFGDKP